MNSSLKARTIHTGLYGAQAKEVIDNIHGQLSDGKWENAPGYDKYWLNFDVKTADDGEVIFKVNAEGSTMWGQQWYANPFYSMSDAEFKKWIARKIKAVVNDERRDYSDFGEWDRRNTGNITRYFGHTNEKYGPVVLVADVYCTYEALLGRDGIATKYDSSTIRRVVGIKRTDEEIAKVKAKEAIYAKYRAQIDLCKEVAKNTIKKLEEKLYADIEVLFAEQKAKLEQMGKA